MTTKPGQNPNFLQQHWGKMLIALVIVILIIVFLVPKKPKSGDDKDKPKK